MLTQLSMQQYIDRLSSSDPTPGGGSALASIASQGVALLLMSCNVTISKLDRLHKAVPQQLQELVTKLTPYGIQLLELVDKDAECFDNILSAMRLPKDTDSARAYRTQQLQSAYIASAVSCLHLSSITVHCYHLADIAIALADRYVVSDAHIGKAIMHTCVASSTHNIYANTSCIANTAIREQLETDTATLLAQLD